MSKSIYPSIPAPGNDAASMRATLDAMRQTLTMLIMNAQKPSPNFAPSSAAQVFVTKDELAKVLTGQASLNVSTAAVTHDLTDIHNRLAALERKVEASQ